MFIPAPFFRCFVKQGTLRVIDAEGGEHVYGETDYPQCTIKLHRKGMYLPLILAPYNAIGEGYMNGTFTVEKGTIDDFLLIFVYNQVRVRKFPTIALFRRFFSICDFLLQHNPIGKAEKKVAHHYDISNELYRLFLDKDMQYSCGYFKDLGNTIEAAQQDKKNHIMRKLKLAQGLRVLDIGCGWGGLAMDMARTYGVHVTGVTLSQQQFDLARERVRAEGLEDKVDIRLLDYRLLDGTYDRIVSVGMFEHVGKLHYEEFFRKTNELLDDNGVMLLHSIGHVRPVPVSNPWVEKYIFPGAYIPALSECVAHVEAAGFWMTDVEIWRRHYSYTLKAWKERFRANRAEVLRIKNEVFFRMWEMYLSGFEMAFMDGELMVFQMQLAKNNHALPLTRDYMYAPTEPFEG
ncbi:MAG: cyclopropane-fatty-acyl-phospholipid synthase family protein [Pseudomonadota bacterium]|nr:cyclopropane-fatty-acyl-phospholipid synthase family protein [Pseudomonadota bacterium]